jgi:phospholipase/carboxylesterase
MQLVHAAYEPEGDGPHPTVIALHGWGANALDLLGLAPHIGGGRFLVLCPQGHVTVPVAPGMSGYGWFPLSMGAPPDAAAVVNAVEAIEGFIEVAQRRYPVDRDRLALLGFSQGGAMAYAVALRGTSRFAALAALSTWFPPGLVGGTGLDRLPVLVQHGARDELIPAERSRESVERLRQYGSQVVYREYDMGHEISAASLRDLADFLRQRLLPPGARV